MTDKRADDCLLLGIIGLLAFALLMLLVNAAAASQSCLTYGEARTKWPREYLRWSGDHCWYVRSYRPERPVRRIAHVRRNVSPLVQPEPVQIIEDAPTFVPWDDRVGIPTVKP
jgi:hypothetical protein